MKSMFDDPLKFEHINLTEVKFTEDEDDTRATLYLCLVVKGNNDVFIEDVFRAKVKTGRMYGYFEVRVDSAEFDYEG